MYKVLIADDETIIRSGITKLLAHDPEVQVVAQAPNGKAALEAAREHLPDLLLVDINMPFLSGLEFIEQLGDLLSGAVIIVITGFDDFAYAQQSLRLGVFDYLLKPINENDFFEAIARAKEQLGHNRKRVKYLEWAKLQLEKNRAVMVTHFLEGWLAGRYSEPEILEQTEYLDLTLPQPFGVTVAQFSGRAHYAEYERDWDEHLLYYAAENIARETFAPLQPVITQKNASGDLVILSGCEPEEEWRRLAAELASRLAESLPAQPTMGQAAGQRCDEVAAAYDQAMEELEEQRQLTPMVATAKRLIEGHYDSPELSLQWVAKQANVSAQYLCRLFRQETGMTFVDYVTQLRIGNAVRLLLETELKIYEIAERIGYSTQHYFSSAFKKVLGMSPAEYRKSKK